ncbi:MAG: enoyl-CoA hydratase/isomerase family protein [Azonexus sp.]|nr:enoyl-CoA hydratase/isomerase family protein [Azonexus sp.]MBP6906085.1 enoyl-CoA hydratase/isomerase family protein [Azonexus sp.]
MNTPLRHWRFERDGEGLASAILDRAGAATNALSREVLEELGLILDHCEREVPAGLVIRSGKEAGFVAGADIDEFAGLDSASQALTLVERGWRLFERLAGVPYPTLALVRGHCLGGGLELALACRTLLVVDEPATRLGLPEVLLGIFPGWGGMARLPRRVGPAVALDLMLSGRSVDARRARQIGLADECVAPRVQEAAVRQGLLSSRGPRPLALGQRLLNGPLKALAAAGARRQLAQKARPEHYPAPYAILELWQRHGGNPLAAPAIVERIVASPTAHNLLRVYGLQERLKAFGKDSSFRARRVHVVGAGVMGGDIAAWCALSGLTVSLEDRGLERIAPALARAEALFARRLRDPLARRDARDRLVPDPTGAGVALADVVIEAVFEDAAVKRALLARLEARLKPGALLATNTSSLRLEAICPDLARPRRLVGIHFFNPVAQMPLVEVVRASGTDQEAVSAACAFVRQIDKLPLPVASAPGFLVNAVLAPYLREALLAVDEGVDPAALDAALVAFGMPLGPVELADTVGLDIVLAAGRQLVAGEAPRGLAERVARGDLGKKSGRGFYAWTADGASKGRPGRAPAGIAERLLEPLIARTGQLVREGVVADADLADAGVIFGTGFAPYTGGPLNLEQQRSKER